MKHLLFIRHGKTFGNTEGRYIGITDEPLCGQGRKELLELIATGAYGKADLCLVSPMLRCRETKEMIYPDVPAVFVPDLREKDFGEFEGKNYPELNGDPRYQAWIDSGGELPFPAGESGEEFRNRVRNAFADCVKNLSAEVETIAFVVHGGTIMALMSAFAENPGFYFDWQVKNGKGYAAELDDSGVTPVLRAVRPLF